MYLCVPMYFIPQTKDVGRSGVLTCRLKRYKATEDLHRDIQVTQCSNILLGDDAFQFEKNTKTITSFRLPTQTTTIPLRKFTEFYGGPTDRRTDGGTDGRTDGRLGFPKARNIHRQVIAHHFWIPSPAPRVSNHAKDGRSTR